jgi:feruloyl-CoA synthase
MMPRTCVVVGRAPLWRRTGKSQPFMLARVLRCALGFLHHFDHGCRAARPMSLRFFDNPQLLAPRRVERFELAAGAYVLRSPEALAPYAHCVGEWLEHWAAHTPHALAFAEPVPRAGPGAWRKLSWLALRQEVGAVAQALLDLNLPADHPVVVLSDNSLDHLVLSLATMHIGRAVCTVSSGYSRLAQDGHARLRGIVQALGPALIYASDGATYGAAVQAVAAAAMPGGAHVVFSEGAAQHAGALAFADLQRKVETAAVMQAFAQITPDTHAKYLLTSGSTGQPKVVINSHRMLCANQQMLAQTLRFMTTQKPVLLDWLPWSHTFGGNHNVNIVLRNGGTMYIDDGRPMPGGVERTIQHLREVQPTVYFNVPRGYEMLLPVLEADLELAARFLVPLRMAFYAGAGMPVSIWQRLQTLGDQVRPNVKDDPLWLTTSWGSTETAPAVTFAHWQLDRPGVIGLPMPGVSVKFVPNAGKLEMRVKGDNVFPAYRHNPEATQAAFDEDGYYCIGDAGHFLDEADPLQGIVFNGRVAEDFKLTSGTWVSVGTLRVKLVSALAPHVQDVVVTGHDRSDIGILVFLNESGRALGGPAMAAHVQTVLRALKAGGAGSSQAPTRALLLPDAPNAAAGEITDKGYVNQRLVLSRRAADVLALYTTPTSAGVILV